MRNPFRLLNLGRRRRPGARANPLLKSAARRYEVPRAEPRRIEPLRAERRRPSEPVNWRRRSLVALAGLSTIAAVTGIGWLLQGDTFRVQVVDVRDAQVVDPQAVVRTAGLSGASMLTIDLERAGRAVTRLPAVKSATVTRDWPNGIRIAVTEHLAWGYWQVGSERLVIDEYGRILDESRPPPPDAPTIVEVASATPDLRGVTADADTVQLVQRLRTDGTFQRLDLNPTAFLFRRDRGLIVLVADAPAAVLGDSSNYEFKVRTWQAVMEKVRGGQVPAINVQAQVSPVAVSSDEAQVASRSRTGPSSGVASEIDLRFGRNVVLR